MDPRRWEEIRAAFEELVALDEASRASRLVALGATDPALRRAVEDLLAADAEAEQQLAPLEAAFLSPAKPLSDPLGLVGRTVSHFRVVEPLGAGGMGMVYRALDTRLGRAVALKFLQPQLSPDETAKARFLREARSAAALDHPNLCTIHEVGESEDGHLFLAMALYPGETLNARLEREGRLSVGDALGIARQIAQGLVCAHAAGIVHRDLKPGNVMLLPDGTAKILDFGLAKARDQSLTDSGTTLGTVAYMAPEQFGGDRVDGRADLWALGVVLYEMLTGQMPFAGGHEVGIAHAILHDEPVPPATLQPEVPAPVEDLVLTLLHKDPAMRHPTAEALLAALTGVGTLPESAVRSARPRWLRARRTLSGKRRWTLAVVATAVVGIVGVMVLAGRRGGGEPPSFVFGRSVQVTADPGLEIQPALSPDGRFVAYAAGTAARMRIYIRPVAGGRTIPLSDDSTAVESQPRWSPDGNRVLYLTHGSVSIAPAFGGVGQPVIGPSATDVGSATWSPDGSHIAFVRADSVLLAPVQGGSVQLIALADAHSCTWSPDGRWIACVVGSGSKVSPGVPFGNLAPSAIVLMPAAGGPARQIIDAQGLNTSPAWSPDSRRLFFISNREGPRDVFVVEITSGGEPRGAPSRVTAGLNAQSLSISSDGARLAYNVYVARSNVWSLPIPTSPPVTADAATQVTTGNQLIENLGLSPDGKWLLYDSDLSGNADIFRVPITGGPPEQLTSESFDEFAPSLSPDGHLLAYHSFRTRSRDIEVKPLDGSAVERVTDSPQQEANPLWSPDGRRLMYFDLQSGTILIKTRRGPGDWSTADTIARSWGSIPSWSPDGREIACGCTDSTAHERRWAILIRSLASRATRVVYMDSGASQQVIPQRGLYWASDGRMYLKNHDAQGHAFIWQIAEGRPPRLLVRFPDLNRPSNRAELVADRTHFYFTLENRESDVFVADVTRRSPR